MLPLRNMLFTGLCSLFMLLIPILFLSRILQLPLIEQKIFCGIFLVPLGTLFLRGLKRARDDLWLPVSLGITSLMAALAFEFSRKNPDALVSASLWFRDRPDGVLMGLVAVMAVKYLLEFSAALSDRILATALGYSSPDVPTGLQVTALDRATIAAHEAGHAVVLGLHKKLPETSEVIMRLEPTDSGSLGHCTGVSWQHAISQKSFIEWSMWFCLAGIEAERIVLGEVSLGGTSDYRQWQTLALQYLTGHDCLVYFHEIHHPWQEEYNAKVLYDLKEQQKAHVRDVLLENEHVLLLVRDALLERGVINGKDLVELLSSVVATPHTPSSPLLKGLAS